MKLILPRFIDGTIIPALKELAQKSETVVDDKLLEQLSPLLSEALHKYIDSL